MAKKNSFEINKHEKLTLLSGEMRILSTEDRRVKDPRYGNRGMSFESFVTFACERYKKFNVAVIDKQNSAFIPIRDRSGKIVTTKIEKKATVDYLGRYKNIPIAMEAKHTSTESIRWDAVQPHQAEYLDLFTKEPGTIGFVLLSFGMKRFYAIPWAFWQAAYNARARTGSSRTSPETVSAFGITWDIPKKNSVRMDEIPAQFEIIGDDRTYGLHFLFNADKYITPEVTIKT